MELNWVKKGNEWHRGQWRVRRVSEPQRDDNERHWGLFRVGPDGAQEALQTAFTARSLMEVADVGDGIL